MNDLDQLKQDLILASSILEWDIGDIWGHVSARLPDRSGFLLKHLRHQVKDPNNPEEVIAFDNDGKPMSKTKNIPREIVLYSTLYRTRPEVNGVVHSHPPITISLMAVNQKIVPIHLHSFIFHKSVPVYPEPLMICTKEEGKALDKTMGKQSSVLIKGHGAVTVARTMHDATIAMLYLERTARMIATGTRFGKITSIPSKYIDLQFDRLATNKNPKRLDFQLEWDYYTTKLKKGELWTRG